MYVLIEIPMLAILKRNNKIEHKVLFFVLHYFNKLVCGKYSQQFPSFPQPLDDKFKQHKSIQGKLRNFLKRVKIDFRQ